MARTTPLRWQVWGEGGLFLAVCLLAAKLVQQRIHLGLAWEDSYHHWLVSAHGWVTGDYRDPLAGHAAFLPVVHWIYGCVLGLTGLYNLPALQITAASVMLLTALGLYRWGGWGVAVLFLLNPVTILTGSLPVAEPWAVFFLLVGLWAWDRTSDTGDGWRREVAISMAWTLAMLTDRGTWPVILGVLIWDFYHKQSLRWWLLLVMAVILIQQWGLGTLTTTAAWAKVDHGNLTTTQQVQYLWRYSAGVLGIPLGLAGLALLRWPKLSELEKLCTWLSLGYGLLIVSLVATGQLTGSPRYYLQLIPLLLLSSRSLLQKWSGLTLLALLPLVSLNRYYLQQWPHWVILNQPSVKAGNWLRTQNPGMLYTDSPLVVYYSHWPVQKLAASQFAVPHSQSWLILVGDNRYHSLFPALTRFGNQPLSQDFSQDWTVRYGAKPVKVYALN